MAQVDFSNATIEVYQDKPFDMEYLNLNTSYFYSAPSSGTSINSGATVTKTETLNTVTLLYSGSFNTSGTEFYIRYQTGGGRGIWKVSNISFSSGDLYSFAIDMTITVV